MAVVVPSALPLELRLLLVQHLALRAAALRLLLHREPGIQQEANGNYAN